MGAREDMIDAAERLVAERGMPAMSLREVQKAAGQRNKSAAQYHFGTRHGLIEAIATTRMAPINEDRFARLAELDAADAEPSLRDLVRVMVEPLAAATLRPGSCWARFLIQGYADPEVSDAIARGSGGRGYWATRDRILERVDHLPDALRERRVDHAIGVLVLSLAAAERRQAELGATALPPSVICSDLVDTCVALLEAPASPSTLAELDRAETRIA